jgi:hypothetical protein
MFIPTMVVNAKLKVNIKWAITVQKIENHINYKVVEAIR